MAVAIAKSLKNLVESPLLVTYNKIATGFPQITSISMYENDISLEQISAITKKNIDEIEQIIEKSRLIS